MMKEAPGADERQQYADGWSKRAKWFNDLPNEINAKFSPFPKQRIERCLIKRYHVQTGTARTFASAYPTVFHLD